MFELNPPASWYVPSLVNRDWTEMVFEIWALQIQPGKKWGSLNHNALRLHQRQTTMCSYQTWVWDNMSSVVKSNPYDTMFWGCRRHPPPHLFGPDLGTIFEPNPTGTTLHQDLCHVRLVHRDGHGSGNRGSQKSENYNIYTTVRCNKNPIITATVQSKTKWWFNRTKTSKVRLSTDRNSSLQTPTPVSILCRACVQILASGLLSSIPSISAWWSGPERALDNLWRKNVLENLGKCKK